MRPLSKLKLRRGCGRRLVGLSLNQIHCGDGREGRRSSHGLFQNLTTIHS